MVEGVGNPERLVDVTWRRVKNAGFFLLLLAGGVLPFGWLIWPPLGGIAAVFFFAAFVGAGVWELICKKRQGPRDSLAD